MKSNNLSDFQQFLQLKAIEGYPEQGGVNGFNKDEEADSAPSSIEGLAHIEHDIELLALWRENITEQGKRNDLNNNISNNVTEVNRGNTKAYTVERLKREAPEIFERVKKLSNKIARFDRHLYNP